MCFNKNLRGLLRGASTSGRFTRPARRRPPSRRRPKPPPPERERQSDYFHRALPEACLDFARETGQRSQFACLVVDEGQDLLRPAYVDCIDLIVRGGLRGGRWQICYDPGQDIYNGESAEVVEQLRGQLPFHTYPLRVNCRNTSAIAICNRLLTGIDCGRPRLRLFRPEVKVQYYETPSKEAALVRQTIDDLLGSGVKRREIVLLGRRTMPNSCLQGDAHALGADLPVLELGSELTRAKLDQDIVKYCTIWGFKGIAAPAVLLLDVEDWRAGTCCTLASRGRERRCLSLCGSTGGQSMTRGRGGIGRRRVAKMDALRPDC